jgi:hypothetical protein
LLTKKFNVNALINPEMKFSVFLISFSLICLFCNNLYSQGTSYILVKGTVYDKKGEPVTFANVFIKGTITGAT